MAASDDICKIPAALFEALQTPGPGSRDLIETLQGGLKALAARGARQGDLDRLLHLIVAQAARDRLRQRTDAQKAQFLAQHLRAARGPYSAPPWPLRLLSGWRAPDWPAAPRFSEDLPKGLRRRSLRLVGKARPAISVIIPSWNRRHVVAHAVASALLQSLAAHEVIVVDDGSTDSSADLLETQFADACAAGQLKVLRCPHQGVSAARNAGLAAARGDIIAYLDSDNTWEPDHLLFACTGLLETPRAEAAYTALNRHNLSDGWSDILFHPYDRAALETENTIDLNSFVHHRALFDRFGGFDTALTRLVDWDLILRYTAHRPPVAMPVITGHYLIERATLRNITATEAAEPNIARIRAKLQAAGA